MLAYRTFASQSEEPDPIGALGTFGADLVHFEDRSMGSIKVYEFALYMREPEMAPEIIRVFWAMP
jgi:hypothetical protein